jgi:molecular chaperone GrpE
MSNQNEHVEKEKEDEGSNEKENGIEAKQQAADSKCKESEPDCSALKNELSESNDRFIRLVAEYENYRKRSAKEKEQIYSGAIADVVKQFLSAIDSLQTALALNIPDSEFKKGIELVYGNCCTALKTLGVEETGKIGEKFDPHAHNAVLHIDDDSVGENEIVEVLQKGYSVGQKVIRHAMVKVAN